MVRFAENLDDDPSYAGLAIVASGLQVYVVEPPSERVSSAIDSMRALVPVETQAVRNSLADLMKVTARLTEDHGTWKRRGVLLSGWGPHFSENLVKVSLQSYEPEFGQALIDEYGADVLTVSTTPTIWKAF